MGAPDHTPNVRDNSGRRHSVRAVLMPGGSMVTTRVCAPDGTHRPGLATTWTPDEAEIYALQLLTAAARARVIDEAVARENSTARRF